MCAKIKLAYLEILISVIIICNLNTVVSLRIDQLRHLSSNETDELFVDAVPKPKSFRKCLEYLGTNGTIGYLLPTKMLHPVPFIVVGGGYDAEPKQFPFMAALGYGNETEIKYFCGGTLLSDRFVLTAAHCIFSIIWGPVKFVRLGDLNIQADYDDDDVQLFHVQDYHVHPNYKFPLKYHDIALIKLDKPVVFSRSVSPACLDFSRNRLPQPSIYVAGWGAIEYGGNPKDNLQFGNIVKYNISDCQKTFSKGQALPNGIVGEFQMCAGAGLSLTDTCEGDSGGPLGQAYILDRDQSIHFVIGVTSFGKTCMIDKIPAVYTKVSYYTDWIESVVWPEENGALSDKIVFPTK